METVLARFAVPVHIILLPSRPAAPLAGLLPSRPSTQSTRPFSAPATPRALNHHFYGCGCGSALARSTISCGADGAPKGGWPRVIAQ